jgi:hypothetical protein
MKNKAFKEKLAKQGLELENEIKIDIKGLSNDHDEIISALEDTINFIKAAQDSDIKGLNSNDLTKFKRINLGDRISVAHRS